MQRDYNSSPLSFPSRLARICQFTAEDAEERSENNGIAGTVRSGFRNAV